MKLLALTSAVVLTLGLAGCGATAPVGEPSEHPGPGASEPPRETGGSGSVEDCGGLTTADLAAVFGVELDGPSPSTGNSHQNGATWASAGCDWENDAEDLEIDLDLSGPTDFPDGGVICVEPGGVGDVTPVDALGTQAWWKFDDFDEVEGELRVCTDDALVEIAVDAPSGSFTSDDLCEKVADAVRIVID